MQKLKVDDEVVVLTGKDKGKKGKVKLINWKKRTVLVNGINMVRKAVKRTEQNPYADFTNIEASLDMSNVSVMSPKTKKATRVRIERRDGKNVRLAVSCGTVLG